MFGQWPPVNSLAMVCELFVAENIMLLWVSLKHFLFWGWWGEEFHFLRSLYTLFGYIKKQPLVVRLKKRVSHALITATLQRLLPHA